MTKRKVIKAKANRATTKANTATSKTQGLHISNGPMSVKGTGHNKKAKQHITLANRHARHQNIYAPASDKRAEKQQQNNPGTIITNADQIDQSKAHSAAKIKHIKAAVAHRKAAKTRKTKKGK